MKKTIITVIATLLIVVICMVFLPLFFGYKITYLTRVDYDFAAIGAVGQWVGAIIPILLVFLSAYVTQKIDEGKKDIASSNIATVDYIKSIEKELNEKINKLVEHNELIPSIQKTEEEIREAKKEAAYKFICIAMFAKTEAVAKHLGVSKEDAFELLLELLRVDGRISAGGMVTKENMDNLIWLKKSN